MCLHRSGLVLSQIFCPEALFQHNFTGLKKKPQKNKPKNPTNPDIGGFWLILGVQERLEEGGILGIQ